jgi:tetratricopeptide (TPR) repeat protein
MKLQQMRLRLKHILPLILFWIAAGLNASAATGTEILLKEARQLMAASKEAQALQKYEKVLETEPHNYEALCKASLLSSRIGNRFTDLISRLTFFEEAWQYADAAVCTDSVGCEGNYVMALAVYNKAMASGMKERMLRTRVIKFYLDKALLKNPKHADSWQLLGRWYYKNANLSLPEKAALKMFFEGVPVDATNEKALEALNKAIECNPSNITYYYDLAMVYRELQKADLYEVTLEQAIGLKLVTSEELEICRRCKALLTQLNKS